MSVISPVGRIRVTGAASASENPAASEGAAPSNCVNCPQTGQYRDDVLLCVQGNGGKHRVMGRLPWMAVYEDLGDHEQLDSAHALAKAVLRWQDIEDGERVWLATLTFRDVGPCQA